MQSELDRSAWSQVGCEVKLPTFAHDSEASVGILRRNAEFIGVALASSRANVLWKTAINLVRQLGATIGFRVKEGQTG
jgi:hypothetical protein